EAARILAEEGPKKVEEWLLERLQVPFDREPSGELSLALEGGHSLPRILHAADATGLAIHRTLKAALEAHPHVTVLKGHTAIDLLTPA
ncbi:FAD-binding protein, partial [Escherichia coli]|nr:FAD-binding protein [Escherichia coli]